MPGDLLGLADISMEESEDLPRILGPLAEDAAAAALGRAGAGADAAPARAALLAALEARAPALLRLRVSHSLGLTRVCSKLCSPWRWRRRRALAEVQVS